AGLQTEVTVPRVVLCRRGGKISVQLAQFMRRCPTAAPWKLLRDETLILIAGEPEGVGSRPVASRTVMVDTCIEAFALVASGIGVCPSCPYLFPASNLKQYGVEAIPVSTH